MKQNYLQWNIRVLKTALKKIGINVFIIIAIDFLFWTLLSFTLSYFILFIRTKYNSIDIPADLGAQGIEVIERTTASAKELYNLIVISIILFGAIFILASGILKGLIWALTAKVKISFKYIIKFFAMNSILSGLWFILSIAALIILNIYAAPKIILIMFLIYLYITTVSYALFTKNEKISCIKQAIKLSLGKVRLFLLPCTLILSIAFILFLLLSFISYRIAFPYTIYLIEIVSIAYIGIIRYYLLELIKELS